MTDDLISKAMAISPFQVEYIIQERIPVADDAMGPGAYRPVTILITDDFDIAHGALAGLKMQCGLRDRSGTPNLKHGRAFVMLSRVVTPYADNEGTTAFLEAANEGLRLYDLAHGWPKEPGT